MADHDGDDDDFNYSTADLNALLAQRPTAPECLAKSAIAFAINGRARSLIARGSCVLILKAPSADWASLIARALPNLAKDVMVSIATERAISAKIERRIGADDLQYVQQGKSVVFVSQSPTEILDEAVLLTADATITITHPSPALLRTVIRQVTTGNARGVTTAMAALPLHVILASIRPGLSARDCVTNLARAVVPLPAPHASEVPLLTELPLTQGVRHWADTTLADMAAVSSGDLDSGVLEYGVLEGVPGTGKTLIAASLAQTAGWSFISTTVGDFFVTGDGALGGVARNVRAFFQSAVAAQPAVAFLDELDSIPNRAALDGRSRDWWTPVVNLILVEIDRLRKSGAKVKLIGGTNFYSRLDQALVRPGRMRERISVVAPQTLGELTDVFRYHLGADLADADLLPLSSVGMGATPAMVEGWVKLARATARAAGRAVTIADLFAEMVPNDNRSSADIRAIAIHEAGHALVCNRLGHKVQTVSIIANGTSGGHTASTLPTLVATRQHLEDIVTVMLAGRAADVVIGGGANVGAASDLEVATKLLLAAHDHQGLHGSLLFMPAVAPRPSRETIQAVSDELQRLLARAVGMVEAERDLALEFADRLMQARVLSGEAVSAILGPPSSDFRSHFGG